VRTIGQFVEHPFEPVYNNASRILILGSFPSVKSREGEFYYHHPQNRFWKVISTICNTKLPLTIEEKKQILYDHGIALWDVVQSCEITGSSDSSIKNVKVNNISEILSRTKISKIIANASFSLEKLIEYWSDSIII